LSANLPGSFTARCISWALVVLCAIGLLQAWTLDGFVWYIFEALIFALFIAWTVGWVLGGLQGSWSYLFLPFLSIVLWAALQLCLGWSVYAFTTKSDAVRWACYFSIFFLASQLFGSPGREDSFRKAFAVFAFALAVVSVLQYLTGNGKIYWLFQSPEPAGLGPFLNHDHYASFVALALPMPVVEAHRSPSRRWIFLVGAATLYASVIASASRAGFILVTVELVVLILMLGFERRSVVAVFIITLGFAFVLGWDNLYTKLRIPDPYASRRVVAEATIDMIKASPWKGFGLGTWTLVYPAYAKIDFGLFGNAAHNDWLQWAAEGGVPLIVCLFLLFCGAVALARQAPWAIGVPVVFLHCLIDFPMQGRFLPAVLFLVFGVATASALRRDAQTKEALAKRNPATTPA
jgi:O-antigen ligase